MLLLSVRLIAGFGVPDPTRAVLLLALAALVLLTLSLLGSTLLPTLANGVAVFTLFGLAWLTGLIEFIGTALDNATMLNTGTAVGLLVPSDALWRGATYYVQSPLFLATLRTATAGQPMASTVPPVTPLVVWAALYVLAGIAGAMWSFARRDL